VRATSRLAEDALQNKPDDRALRFKSARFLLGVGNGSDSRNHLLTLRSDLAQRSGKPLAETGADGSVGDTGIPEHENGTTLGIMLAKAESIMEKYEDAIATASQVIGFDVQARAFIDDAPASPGAGEAYVIVASILAERFRDPATADRVMARLVETQAEDPLAWLVRARWHRQLGNLDAASADLEVASSLASDNPEILLTAFEVALAKQDYREASVFIEEKLKLFQQDERVVRGRAVLAMQQQQHDRAVEVLEEGLRTRPDNPTFLTMLLDAFCDANRIDDAAKTITRLGEVLGPDHAAVGMYEARILLARQEWNEARTKLEAVRPLAVQSAELTRRVDLLLGTCFERLGQVDQQAEANRRVLKDSPDSLDARISLASALHAAGRPVEALAEFEAISRSFPPERLPTAPQIWKPLLELRIQKQLQRPVAERDWTEADSVVAMLQESPAITDSQLALVQAEVLIQKGEGDSAIDLLQRSRDSAPGEAIVAAGLIKALAQAGRIIEASAVAESLPPEIKTAADVLAAEVRVAKVLPPGQSGELLTRIESDCEKLAPLEAADVLTNVAAIYAGAGNDEDAERVWRQVLEKSPNVIRRAKAGH